jgi:hypothetical protein
MKNLVILIILIIVGVVVYNSLNAPKTEEGLAIQEMRNEFREAQQLLRNAERSAATAGIDTTSQAENAVLRVKKIKQRLTNLLNKLEEDRDIDRAEKLLDQIDLWLRKNPA